MRGAAGGDDTGCPVEERLRDCVEVLGGSGCTGQVRAEEVGKDIEDDFVGEVIDGGHYGGMKGMMVVTVMVMVMVMLMVVMVVEAITNPKP